MLQELIQHLPSKEDMASMLTRLDASMQEKLSSITAEVRQIGLRVGDLEGDRDNIQLKIYNLEQRQDAQDTKIVQKLRHTEDLDNRGRINNLRIRGIPEAQGDPENNLLLQSKRRYFAPSTEFSSPKCLPNTNPKSNRLGLANVAGKEGLATSHTGITGKGDPLPLGIPVLPYSIATRNTTVHDIPDFLKLFDIPQMDIQDWYDPWPQGSSQALPQRPRWSGQTEKRRITGKRLPFTPASRPRPASQDV
ncbi:Hypothetical predicted protein [Pelobates cultripes]|uniref:Uncharacterized protein n=1 Tax=Pelobates cultripes TaxID=61616 RepID=A0AAD1RFE1_PELCU|nr:Hypothetical predicted protein [Pelobates cultripes]